jgi:glucose-1-phosphate thymidylyltransferase
MQNSRLLFDSLQEQIDKDIKNHGEYQITDVLQMMIDQGETFVPFEIDEWFDCGKPETLLETNRRLLIDKKDAPVPNIPGSIVVPPVAIAATAVVKSSIIGPHVSIAANSVVENSIVRDSVLDRGSRVADCLLEGSIIGSHAVVKGRVKMLNIGDSSEVIFK